MLPKNPILDIRPITTRYLVMVVEKWSLCITLLISFQLYRSFVSRWHSTIKKVDLLLRQWWIISQGDLVKLYNFYPDLFFFVLVSLGGKIVLVSIVKWYFKLNESLLLSQDAAYKHHTTVLQKTVNAIKMNFHSNLRWRNKWGILTRF